MAKTSKYNFSFLKRYDTLKKKVIFLLSKQPMTKDELMQYTGAKHQTLTSVLTKLQYKGIVKPGKIIQTLSGVIKHVWELTPIDKQAIYKEIYTIEREIEALRRAKAIMKKYNDDGIKLYKMINILHTKLLNLRRMLND